MAEKDDLLKMLDLSGSASSPADVAPLEWNEPAAAAKPPAGPYAVSHRDHWSQRRGQDIARHEPELAALDFRNKPETLSDIHASLFESDPELIPCTDAKRQKFLEELVRTPEYAEVRCSTTLDAAAAAVATVAIAQQYAKIADPPEDEGEEGEGGEGAGPKGRKGGGGKGGGKGGKGKDRADDLGPTEDATEAAEAAKKALDEYQDCVLGMGLSEAENSQIDVRRALRAYRKVRHDPRLSEILARAGRFRRFLQAAQRQKVFHGYDDLVGVRPDDDVGRLCPSELLALGSDDETVELDFYRRLIEKQTLCREYRGVDKVGKGPVILCVDESGSMHGEPICDAKALVLALAWNARKEKRWVGLVAYSGDTGERLLTLRPDKWDEGKLMDWLTAFIGGGSNMDVPVRELPEYWKRLGAQGKTDVFMVTDAICDIPSSVQAAFLAWKKQAKAKVYTLVVSGYQPGDLAAISDVAASVKKIDLGVEAVEDCLSL